MSTSVTLADAARSPDLRHIASRLRKPEHGRFSARNLTAAAATSSPPVNSSLVTTEFAPQTATDSSDGATSCSPVAGGHIRVAVRVRPLPSAEVGIIEVAGNSAIAIRKEAATGGNQFLATQQGRIEERQFDRVFGPQACQEEVYAWTCEPLVQKAMKEARNMTVFVYGATGAGKTHTMFGAEEEDEQGIIFRTVREVFEQIESQKLEPPTKDEWRENFDVDEDGERFEVRVSFLELYNENVRDLLQDGTGATTCRVLEDERRGVVQVSNLVEVPVRSVEEATCLLRAGMQARTVEATAANAVSSRAHAVFSLSVERVGRRNQRNGLFKSHNPEARLLHSKISLIDLAGSERAKDTHNSGSALKDGARINQSLLALANCIDALTAINKNDQRAVNPSQKKKPPYRDSKLTLMLKGSLTGDGLVAMVANVHPGRSHFEDSNNTLEYAMRATTVKAREQRRCRSSLVGTRPSGIPPVTSAQSARRRLSAPAFPQSARTSVDEEGCTASSSTLPPPRNSARCNGRQTGANVVSDRIKLDPRKTAFAWSAAAREEAGARQEADSGDSTVSSPGLTSPQNILARQISSLSDQEHLSPDGIPVNSLSPEGPELSVLSLPSDEVAADEDEYSDFEDEDNHIGMQTCLEESLVDEEEVAVEPMPSAIMQSSPAKAGYPSPAPNKERTASKEGVASPFRVMLSPSPAKEGAALPAFVAKIIAQLQAEKVDLDERLRCVTSDRDALLQDRAELELANARLREANMEKDRQLASLLVAAVTPTA